MFDFRLKVFHTVAHRLNFSKAAAELFISQPAVSKHIHEIEAFYKTKLFERNGTRIKLTQAGNVLLSHVDELMKIYRSIDFELSSLSAEVKGSLHIGASTTVAQYFLPKYLAVFKGKFPDVKIQLTTGNTEAIENLLSDNKIDVAIVEGQTKRKHLKYTPLVQDELVLCTRSANASIKKATVNLQDLQKLPLVMREAGSGSLEVISAALKQVGLQLSNLNVQLEFQSIESIKSYLLNSNTFAFLSIHAIFNELKSGALKIIDVKGLAVERHFYFVSQQGAEHGLAEMFFKQAFANNLKL